MTKSVTPRGVEHSNWTHLNSWAATVTKSVTPRGVEHTGNVNVSFPGASDQVCDAERR